MQSIDKEHPGEQVAANKLFPGVAHFWALMLIFAFGAVVAIASLWLPTTPLILASIGLAVPMLIIAWIDLREFRIPDKLSLPLIPLGLAASGHLLQPAQAMLIDPAHLVSALVGGGSLWAMRLLYWRLRRLEGLGLGDVKLAAAGGAWVGLDALPEMFLVACGLALTAAVAFWLVCGRMAITATTALPFGAALAPAIWIVWFCNAVAFFH